MWIPLGVPDKYNEEVAKLLKKKLDFGMRVEAYVHTQIIDDEPTHMIYIPKLIKVLQKYNFLAEAK